MSEAQAQQQNPPLVVNIQYVKDLSFEVPSAPEIFATLRSQPNVNINLDVQARKIQENENVFEVTLSIKAEATEPTGGATGQTQQTGNGSNGSNGNGSGGTGGAAPRVVFIAELAYCGIFTLTGLPDANVEPVLLVECPRLLFPYARNILADITRDGGFPPVLLQPIDFVALWQSRRPAANA